MFDFTQARTAPTAPMMTELGHGLVAGTKVATQVGWRVIEGVAVGDQCLTFDRGLQTVVSISRRTVTTNGAQSDPLTWPLTVPVGALGNQEELVLLCDQSVLIESDTAEQVFGDPFAMIPASALDGLRGIHRTPPAAVVEVIALQFATDEVIFANAGALFHCPAHVDLLAEPVAQAYTTLDAQKAEILVHFLAQEDCGRTDPRQVARAFNVAA